MKSECSVYAWHSFFFSSPQLFYSHMKYGTGPVDNFTNWQRFQRCMGRLVCFSFPQHTKIVVKLLRNQNNISQSTVLLSAINVILQPNSLLLILLPVPTITQKHEGRLRAKRKSQAFSIDVVLEALFRKFVFQHSAWTVGDHRVFLSCGWGERRICGGFTYTKAKSLAVESR